MAIAVWLPFHSRLARAVHLGPDKPKRGAVVVRRRDALAAAVEGKAGDAGWMREFLELLACLVEQVDGFADCAGEQPLALLAGMSGDVLDPFRTEVGDDRADAAEFAIVAAGDEARGGGVGRQREDGAIMCLDRAPGLAIGDVDEAKRAVAEGEGKRGAGAVEAGGNNEGVELALGAAGFEQEPGGGFAHGSLGEAARFTASLNRTTLEPAPQPRPVQVAPDEHDPAHPRLALLPRPDEIAIGNHMHRLESEPPLVVRV